MQFIPFVSLIFVSHLIKMVSNIGHWMKIIHILLLKATGHIFNNIMIQCFESFCYSSKPFSSPVKNISQQKMPVIYASNVLQCYSKTSCRILRSNTMSNIGSLVPQWKEFYFFLPQIGTETITIEYSLPWVLMENNQVVQFEKTSSTSLCTV